ncbi:peptidylprolyl isomerase [Colwellia sp. MB02u-9]|uniref:peptidylprolyl isomerase n=1 Tax=Colwellia sp. MB02u-9 TaxID=2759823 RepID=UPI0015F74DB5|nr:peptidylprolyl isomerase [Colwellia sp. MB02u-9]MBA6294781.1 peptidylprolyl isomerase [Colwellia sp. MB02u-9]
MSFSNLSKIAIASLIIASASTSATIVEFTTSQGSSKSSFKVNLHDETTPETVANFLKYVNDGDYNNTVVHRVEPGFVMQAGGFAFTGTLPLSPIATDGAIKNEPLYSNVRGTIAMAKVKGNEDSATSQWFVNLSNNSSLDTQNGGFTVFGEVIAGMENIDIIAGIPRCNSTPMPDYSADNCANNFVPGVENFVTIESVIIFDASVNSADSLAATAPAPTNSSSDGGSIAWFSVLFTGLIALKRRVK